MDKNEQIKETIHHPYEIVSTESNIIFDINLGFNPNLDFIPYN